MANISITRRCRRQCGYCFARHERSRESTVDMAPDVFDAALALLLRSRIPVARLLGGEPTEHPLFCDYLATAFDRGFRVVVFSGGFVPRAALDGMAALPASRVSLVLNMADPASDTETLVRRQREVCQALGERVMLGVNVRSAADDPTYMFDWVTKYGLCRTVRVGIAHPIWGGTNDFLPWKEPGPIPVLERLVAVGAGLGVNVGFDCGFTPCMFSREFVESHADIFSPSVLDDGRGEGTPDDLVEVLGVRCAPVVDILPEGECIPCYALSRFCRVSLSSADARNDLVAGFEGELAAALPAGVFRECVHCPYRAVNWCGGGCRARRAMRLRPDASTALRREPTQ